jgi:3-deoxy-D-manno-octulosonic-acid transferase
MKFIYNTIIYIYIFLIHLTAIFNEKAKKFIEGRKNWENILAEKLKSGVRYLWFHCSSLGEFEQGRPLMEKIKNQYPQYNIIITFYSPSGYEIRKNYNNADIIMYLPMDKRRNASKFVNMIKPEKVFFIKYDFWYFFISELKKQNIPTYLISAIFREKQIFFQNSPWGKWYRGILYNFEHLFVQDKKSANILAKIGINNITVSGDTRFDRVMEIARNSKNFPLIDKFKDNFPLIVAGSTWKPDEEILVKFIDKHDNIKIIIAPHEVSSANINRLQQMTKKPLLKYSEANNKNIIDHSILIIDSVGLLSSLYKYGHIAYIGGGFGIGIHNILEPATFGLPVIFGPKYKKFKEAIDLIKKGGAFPVHNYNELSTYLENLLENPEKRSEASKICTNFVEKNKGASDIIITKIFKI